MNKRALNAVCIGMLLAGFAIDLVTPQLFVTAILLGIPIVLSTYAGSRRLTSALVAAALLANAVAGYVNGVSDGYHWDAIGIGDRLLAALSIVLVGALGLSVHRQAERSGAVAARGRQAERERALRRAAGAVRASLSQELVERAIAREARVLLDADRAIFYVLDESRVWTLTFTALRGVDEVSVGNSPPAVELQSTIARIMESGEAEVVMRDEAIGRLVLDTLGGQSLVAAPLVERGSQYGALVLVHESEDAYDAVGSEGAMLRAFGEQAALALAQSRLFEALAKKNGELEQRSDVIRDIVYALSHDLRTPLAAAALTLEQARKGAYGPMPPLYGEILERSLAANDELRRLAETLLLVAKYESGEFTTVREPLDVNALVREAIAQLEPLYASKRLEAVLDMPSEAAVVRADPAEIRRAVVNLLANAVTWSRENGTIHAAVRLTQATAVLEVADEGYGVPAALRPQLFTRFSGGPRRGAGTGLGLYIVRRIAESNGGHVAYRPNEPQGSIFSLTLPRAAALGVCA